MQDANASAEAPEDADVEGPEEDEIAAEQSQEGSAPASRARRPRKARRDRDRRQRRRCGPPSGLFPLPASACALCCKICATFECLLAPPTW